MKNKSVTILIITILLIIVVVGAVIISKKSKNNNSSVNEKLSNNSTTTTKKDELIYNDTKNFDYAEVDGGITIIEFKNYDYIEYDKIYVPSEIDGKTVIGIGDSKRDYNVFGAIFGKCEVIIPDTVKYIGDNAFFGAKGLVKLSGGENVNTVGEFAFASCENLSEVTFINNVTNLADNAFTSCTAWNAKH